MRSIGFTRQQGGFRAWFTVSKNGALRTGLVNADFTVTFVDIDDSASATYTVTESALKGGLYYFDVPSAFITTNGEGEYAAVVEVNATGPKLDAVASGILQVSRDDLRGVALLRYGGAVHIDVNGGVGGTAYGIGTEENPSNNLANALTIAIANGISKFKVRGTISLPSAFPDWQFVGNGEQAEVNVNGQDVADSEFENLVLTGDIGTGPVRLTRCALNGIGGLSGTATECSLLPGVVDITGDMRFETLYSAVAGVATGALNFDGVGGQDIEVRGLLGGAEIRGMDNALDRLSIDVHAGQVVMAATCTDGAGTIRGIGNLTRNDTLGGALETGAFLNLLAIDTALTATHGAGLWTGADAWDEQFNAHLISGSYGEAIRLILANAGANVRDIITSSDPQTGRPLTAVRRIYDNAVDADADTNHRYELTVDAAYNGLANDYLVRRFGAGSFNILTFALVNPADAEIGTVIASPAFTATHSATPATATLDDSDANPQKDVISTPSAFSSDETFSETVPGTSVTFTHGAGDGVASDTAQTSKTWQPRLYAGWTTNPGPYAGADILALTELLSSVQGNGLFDQTFSPTGGGSGAYLVCAYHDAYNGAVPADFEVGNFGNGDVTEVQTGELVTIPGGTAPYSIARSDFPVEAAGGIRFARES
jgi:hypothetical protein